MTPQEAKAAVVYLSANDPRVTIAKEITALAETWYESLQHYTYDQVTWAIRRYYGFMAVDNAGVLTAAQCRKILQNKKAEIEAKRPELEKPDGKPMPDALKRKLRRIGQNT